MAASLSSFDVATCVDRCRLATSYCKTQCNGCLNVAWALFWGGSRSTKPCIFPCKVASAGDPVVELQFPTPLRVFLLCFATQSLQIAL